MANSRADLFSTYDQKYFGNKTEHLPVVVKLSRNQIFFEENVLLIWTPFCFVVYFRTPGAIVMCRVEFRILSEIFFTSKNVFYNNKIKI